MTEKGPTAGKFGLVALLVDTHLVPARLERVQGVQAETV